MECQKCGRKFIESRVAKHESVCKGNMGQNPSMVGRSANEEETKGSNQLQVPQAGQKPQGGAEGLVECSKCSRKFRSSLIAKHEAVCKGKIAQNHAPAENQASSQRNAPEPN